MEYKTRAQWGAAPPKSVVRWNPDKLLGVTAHWFGSPDGFSDHSRCDDQMRSVQAGHMAPGGLGVPRGGSDIGYNHCVCPHGVVFEGRGWTTQTGANGTTDSNRNYAAVCVMLGKNNPATMFTTAVKNALKEVINEWFERGVGRQVVRHGYWTGSECPGPYIGAWVDAKKWREVAVESPLPDWYDDFMIWQLVTRRYEPPAPKPTNVPDDVPDWAWELVTTAQKAIILNGAATSFMEYADARFTDGRTGPPEGMTAVPSLWWPDLEHFHRILNEYKIGG